MLAIEPEKCIDCGLCSLICPANAIKDGRVDDKLCVECHECRANCPEKAIIVT